MTDISYFESRLGKLTCNSEEFFAFVTDIRNFRQFISDREINNWNAEKEYCTFNVSMIGTVSVRLSQKEKYNKVIFDGDALNKNDFSVTLDITDNLINQAEVKISLSADLNPMMKLMASKPIVQFLEILIVQMESFSGWTDITK